MHSYTLLVSIALIYGFNCQITTTKSNFAIIIERKEITQIISETTRKPSSEIDLIDETKNFLSQNGYDLFSNETENSVKLQKFQTFKAFTENPGIKDAIKLIQIYNDLTPNGELDNDTINLFREKRCANPDLRIGSFQGFASDSKGLSRFSAYKAVSKWKNTKLTWKLVKSTRDMSEGNVRRAITEAFQYWSDVTPLKFSEVCSNCKADFLVDFVTRYHGDSYPFDGTGQVLAHAFFPEDGRVHFDDDEKYTEGTRDGTNLRIVAAHEIGHALGLDHSFVQGSLMYPTYRYVENKKNLLHQDDIMGIQSLYGRPSKSPTLTTKLVRTTTRKTTNGKATTKSRITSTPKNSVTYVPPCDIGNDAVFYGPKNQLYVLLYGVEMWLYNEERKGWKYDGLITSKYPKIEPNVRGGVKCKKGFTWFFRSLYVWSYDGVKLRSGFPRFISDIFYPFNPYTAVNTDNDIYLLRGSLAWKFDTEKLRVIGHPQKISNLYRGVNSFVESAVRFKKETYFFKANNNNIYKCDNMKKTCAEKKKHTDWPPCIAPKLI